MISIIIPAHNEEKYIEETLKNINNLSTDKDQFEVLVIENGSTDRTLEIANFFSSKNIKIYSVQTKGVSKAKNFGLTKVSDRSEWIVFLDADTILKTNFINDLNLFLNNNKDKNFVIGTTAVKPLENNSIYARIWMKFYDLGHKYTKSSFAIQIMKASLRDRIKFDEELRLAEDLLLISDCLKMGNFFFLNTKEVLTSVRRFESVGWLRLFLKWNYEAILFKFNKNRKKDYPVIR